MDKTILIRQATEADFATIKMFIRKARINPTGLHWRRFTVAIASFARSGNVISEVIGCIQLKPVPGDLVELASLVVRNDFRGQGIARKLIEHILADSPRPLFLTCRSGLKNFYEKFGFVTMSAKEAPRYYRRLQRLVRVFTKMTHRNETLLVMKLG